MERTLIIVKPDGVQRGLIGEAIRRFEQRGLRFVAIKFMQTERGLAEEHYGEHKGKPFFDPLVSYITSAPVVVMVLEGTDAIAACRKTIGVTKPTEAAPGTIRGDFGLEIGRNLVHASANADDAQREIALWFNENELINWSRDTDKWIFE